MCETGYDVQFTGFMASPYCCKKLKLSHLLVISSNMAPVKLHHVFVVGVLLVLQNFQLMFSFAVLNLQPVALQQGSLTIRIIQHLRYHCTDIYITTSNINTHTHTQQVNPQ